MILAGLTMITAQLPKAISAAPGHFGPVEVVEITATCTTSGAVGGTITVSNRTDQAVSDQVPLVLAQHIPPSRGGSPFFLGTGAGAAVAVSLAPGGGATLSYGPLSTAGVSEDANSLRVEVDTDQRPDINPERSESFTPCAAVLPTPTPTSPPPAGPSPTPTGQLPGVTPGPTEEGGPTATSTGPNPTSEVLLAGGPPKATPAFPQAVKPPDAGLGPPDAGGSIWTLWLISGLALAASGATLSVGAQALRPLHARGRSMGRSERTAARRHRVGSRPAVSRPLAAHVEAIDDFFGLVDMVRTLNQLPGVAQARAVTLQRGRGSFEITPTAGGTRDDVAEALREALGSAVRIDPEP